MINGLIAGFVGATVAATVVVGGVNVVQEDQPKPVSSDQLYTYSSR